MAKTFPADRKVFLAMMLAMAVGCFPWAGTAFGETPAETPAPLPSTESSKDVPRIRFLSETENLGDVPQGETAEKGFVFFNDGNVPLQIVEVRSS